MATMSAAAWAFARAAANRLVAGTASDGVVRGVLAQWIAENGWTWPAPRRNPGNLARGWARSFGYPFTVQTPNPQPGNPIVTFASLSGGAYAYADGLRAFPRYNAAQSLAERGDGLGFAVAVCRAGYGTNEATVRSVYAMLGNPPHATIGSYATTAPLYLRSGAGTNYHALRLMPTGTALAVYATVTGGAYVANGARRTDWLRVKVGTLSGYAAAGFTRRI